jgi:hypothetical protein
MPTRKLPVQRFCTLRHPGHFPHPMALACNLKVRVLLVGGPRFYSLCGPGGMGPGHFKFSRALALRSFSSCRRSSYVRYLPVALASYIFIIWTWQGHTIEERWTSIVVTVILVSSVLVGSLLIHVGTLVDRCPAWYMRQNHYDKSVTVT